MLSRHIQMCSRLGFTPSTSQAVFHTSATVSVLPRARPLDEEIPATVATKAKNPRRDAAQILDLSGKRAKNDIDIIVTDQYLQQWYKMETKSLAADYLALSKSKLSMFVAATAACGFLMAPVPVAAAPLAAATVVAISRTKKACFVIGSYQQAQTIQNWNSIFINEPDIVYQAEELTNLDHADAMEL
uniref:Uncharacterized protein n=1 Tax=Caenorhabditis japonica TaxID=281687 RepID=A0A8R1DEJ8_CAEJA